MKHCMGTVFASTLALLSWGLISLAFGDDASLCVPGVLRLESCDFELRPRVFLPGWRTVERVGGDVTEEGRTIFGFSFDATTIEGYAEARGVAKGEIAAHWWLQADKRTPVEEVALESSFLPESIRMGGFYVLDGQEFPFPEPGSAKHFGIKDDARMLVIKDNKGAPCMSIAFDRPTRIFFQDYKVLNGGGVTLRILSAQKELLPGQPVEWRLVLETPHSLNLRSVKPIVVTAKEKGWVPCETGGRIRPESALDFARIANATAPAGKYGRVVVRNGHFEFSGLPGKVQRFYGVNLCFGANYNQSIESARTFAADLVRRGYNSVRLHHHDGLLVENSADSTVPNPARLRELDALVAACVEKGLYVSTDLYVSRPVPWKEIGVDKPGCVSMSDYKMLVRENEAAFSNLCAFAQNWLTHTNAFTGRCWADEPGLAWISLVNENCPDNFKPTLNAKERSEYNELEARFYSRMVAFLREKVGCKQLFTDMNGWTMCEQYPCREEFDYVDMHFYVDHPRFLERYWALPSRCDNRIPFANGRIEGAYETGLCRLSEKPFTVTEWNFAAPGIYRGMGGIATGAWAAREGWDGLWRFAWSHSVEGVRNPCGQPINYFDISGDPLLLASERAIICLFLRGDLSTGDMSALKMDGNTGTLLINTPRTVGGFAKEGVLTVGPLQAQIGQNPTTLWASSLDAKPIVQSSRILFTHLTDMQNSGARFTDESRRILLDWGKLPHLMKNGRAEISLSLEPGVFDVYVLATDGTRQCQIPAAYADGKLMFIADIGRRKESASYLYEIVRRADGGAVASESRKAFDADFTTGTPGAITVAGTVADAPKGAVPVDQMQAAVQKLLDDAVVSGAQSAAQCCVYIDGKLVVDAWAGRMATNSAEKITGETLFPIFSTEKAMFATAVHIAHERGLLDYEAKISRYWPEFRGGNKDGLTVRQLLGMRTGLGSEPASLTDAQRCDWDFMTRWCEKSVAAHPGQPGYLGITWGWYLGKVVENVFGRPLNEVLTDEVLRPCGIAHDFYFAVPDSELRRVVTVYDGKENYGFSLMNKDCYRKACVPSAYGVANARALARFYLRLSGQDGRPPLIRRDTLMNALKPNRAANDPLPDAETLRKNWQTVWGLGYTTWGERGELDRITGSGGLGGSEAFCDLKNRICIGYTCAVSATATGKPWDLRPDIYRIVGIRTRYTGE